MSPFTRLLFAVVPATLLASLCQAAEKNNVNSQNWHLPAAWNGGTLPTPSDHIVLDNSSDTTGAGNFNFNGNNALEIQDITFSVTDKDPTLRNNQNGTASLLILNGSRVPGGPVILHTSNREFEIRRVNGTAILDMELAADGVFAVTNPNGRLDINANIGEIGGSFAVVKSGAGELRLEGANTFSGDVTVNGGILRVVDSANLGLGSTVTVNNGGELRLGRNNADVVYSFGDSGNAVVRMNGGRLRQTGNDSVAEVTNAVVLDADSDLEAGSDRTLWLSGTVSGPGGFTKGATGGGSGTGTLRLTGANTYSGATVIDEGVVSINNQQALGTTSGITINSAGVLQFEQTGEIAYSVGNGGTIVLNNGGTLRQEADRDAGDRLSLLNPVHVNGSGELRAQGDSRLYLLSDISGAGDVIKQGGGEVRFTDTLKTYTGETIINNGRIRVNVDGMPVNTAQVTVNDGGVLRLGSNRTVSYTLGVGDVVLNDGSRLEQDGFGDATVTNPIVLGGGSARLRVNTDEGPASLTLNGGISGAGGFDQDRPGTLFITGPYSATGAVRLRGGGGVTVLSADTSMLGISQFRQDDGSTLVLNFRDPATYPRITTTGNILLNAGAQLQPVFEAGFDPGITTLTILDAGGSLTGDYTLINTSPIASMSLNKVGSRMDLTFDVDYAATASLLPRWQSTVGQALNTPGGGAGMGALRAAAMNAGSSFGLEEVYGQIAAVNTTAMGNASLTSANNRLNSVQRRMENLRTGSAGMNVARMDMGLPLQVNNWDFSTPVLLADVEPDYARYLLGEDFGSRWSIYTAGSATVGRQDSNPNQSGYRFTTNGFVVGADYRFSESLIGGAFVGYDNSVTQFSDLPAETRAHTATLGAYGSVSSDAFYISGALSYGRHFYETNRQQVFLNQSASGRTGGDQVSGLIESGMEFRSGNWGFIPTLSLQGTQLWIDGYSETGSAAAQSIGAQSISSLQAGAGGRINYLIRGRSVSVIPEVRAAYRHEFLDDGRTIRANLIDGGAPINMTTQDPQRDFALVGGGLNFIFHNATSAFVNYETQLGQTGFSMQTVTAGFRWYLPTGNWRSSPVINLPDSDTSRDLWERLQDGWHESPPGKIASWLNLHGRLHLQYDSFHTRAYGDNVTDPRAINSLFVRRLYLGSLVDFGYGFSAEATGAFAEDRDAKVELHSAAVRYTPSDLISVAFAYDKVPFGLEETTSSRMIKTVERSISSRFFTSIGDLGSQKTGVFVDGELGNAYYSAALVNPGDDAADFFDRRPADPGREQTSRFSYYGRAGYIFETDYGNFNVGGDIAYVPTDFRGRANATAYGYSGHLRYDYGRYSLMGEYLGASYQRDQAAGQSDVSPFGFTIQPAVMLSSKWELVAAVSHVDTNGAYAIRLNQIGRKTVPTNYPNDREYDNATGYYFGFNHFIRGNDIKLSLGVERIEAANVKVRPQLTTQKEVAHGFRTRLQILF